MALPRVIVVYGFAPQVARRNDRDHSVIGTRRDGNDICQQRNGGASNGDIIQRTMFFPSECSYYFHMIDNIMYLY